MAENVGQNSCISTETVNKGYMSWKQTAPDKSIIYVRHECPKTNLNVKKFNYYFCCNYVGENDTFS